MIPNLIVTPEHVTDHGNSHYSADASELRFPVGYIPKLVSTTMGNGAYLILQKVTDGKYEYEQSGGILRLTVWNT